MEPTNIIGAITFCIFIVACIWAFRKTKDNFKIPVGYVPEDEDQEESLDNNPDYFKMIQSGHKINAPQNLNVPDLPTINDMLPEGISGESFEHPYEYKVGAITLKDRRRESSLSSLFNNIGAEPIMPVNSVHRFVDANPHSILGLRYQVPGEKSWDPDMLTLDLQHV